MNKLTTAILVTATALGSVSCKKDTVGDGPVSTQVRNIPAFSGIDLRMNGNVYYTVGAERKLEVTARQSIHGMLETSVIDNKLVIRYRDGKTYDADESIRINITAPALENLWLNTSGSIYVMNDLHTTNLMLRSWGSGSIFLQKVFAGTIDAEATVSGRITTAGGNTNDEKIKTKGSAKIDLAAVDARTVNVHTWGSGNVKVKASERLDVTIEGSGCVYFSGYPYVFTHISGTGRLIRL